MKKVPEKIKISMSGAMVCIENVGTLTKDRDIKILADKINEIINYLESVRDKS